MNSIVVLEPATRSAGRPRSENCRLKILTAASRLLARDGFSRMSIDAIAQVAGVSKTTIYRWWPNKAAIIMEAFLASTEADLYVAPTDCPEIDLAARIRRVISLFRGPNGRVIASVIAEAQSDPEVGAAYRQHLLGPRRATIREPIERMIAMRGVTNDVDIDLAIDLIYGPLYERLLLGHAPLDDAFERDYPRLAVALLRSYVTIKVEA